MKPEVLALIKDARSLLAAATPGPWHPHSDEGPIRAPNGECINGWTYSVCAEESQNKHHICIAKVLGKDEEDSRLYGNVALIAKAPAILTALVDLCEQMAETHDDDIRVAVVHEQNRCASIAYNYSAFGADIANEIMKEEISTIK